MMFRLGALPLLILASLTVAEDPATCPLGYLQVDRLCFITLKSVVNFYNAKRACQAVDGELVEPANQPERDSLTRYLRLNNGDRTFWMGATNFTGTWQFISSENRDAITRGNNAWRAGYPIPNGNQPSGLPANCAYLNRKSFQYFSPEYRQFVWENEWCQSYHKTLCQVRLR